MIHALVLIDKKTHIIQISTAIFKKWKVWKVKFHDGKEAMLYKLGGEWIQRNEDNLTASVLTTIGKYIDEHINPDSFAMS